MLRLIVLSTTAALVAFVFFAIPAPADEIEPEPELAAEPAVESAPEPEQEPEPEPEPEPKPEPVIARDDDFARSGIYLDASLAGAWYTDVKDDVKKGVEGLPPTSPWASVSAQLESPVGLGVRAGYRFHPRLAGEVEFLWFSSANTELDNGEDTLDAYKIETLTLTGNAKGYLFTGRIQPFLLAGAGLMHLDGTDKLGLGLRTSGDDFVARFGGGVDLYVNRNYVVVVEGGYLLPTGKLDGLKSVLWSVGLQYRF